jgi:hypothetical protein
LISQTRLQRYGLNAVYQIVFPHFFNVQASISFFMEE